MAKRTVGEFMTSIPYTIGSDQTLASAARKMHDLQVRHLPVLHGGELVGVVTERDIALVESLPGVDVETLTVDEAMSFDPYTVDLDAPLADVCREMATKKLGSALVMKDGHLRGVFTTVDALNAVAELAG
jgi:acetoin utilization protein AcuB